MPLPCLPRSHTLDVPCCPSGVRALLPARAVSSPRAGEGMRLQPQPKLRSVEPGAVSISLDGAEIAIALARALDLDRSHQVRVV